jgi:hypothetical protein
MRYTARDCTSQSEHNGARYIISPNPPPKTSLGLSGKIANLATAERLSERRTILNVGYE